MNSTNHQIAVGAASIGATHKFSLVVPGFVPALATLWPRGRPAPAGTGLRKGAAGRRGEYDTLVGKTNTAEDRALAAEGRTVRKRRRPTA